MPCFLLTRQRLLPIVFTAFDPGCRHYFRTLVPPRRMRTVMVREATSSGRRQVDPNAAAGSAGCVLPRILEKYNAEEVLFLDVGPTQNALKGKTLAETFPGTYDAFCGMFDHGDTKLSALYFQLAAGYPEGFKVRMPALKVTKTRYQLGLLEYSMLNPKNTIFRSDGDKEAGNYIPTTLHKVHFLQNRSGVIDGAGYRRAVDTLYDFLFYLTGQ